MSQPDEPRGLEDLLPKPRPRRADVQQLYKTLQEEQKPQARLITNEIGMKLALIPAGTFRMGSGEDDPLGRLNERPVHEVIITDPFYLGVTAVTQEQYQQVLSTNPSRFNLEAGGGPDHPVERVSWQDAMTFCRKLSNLAAEREAGRSYRLPTEAEWEYACRAGEATVFSFGNSLSSQQANFNGQFASMPSSEGQILGKTSRVGTYPANNFGLFDMHGNVWEWCADWYDGSYYPVSPTRNPQGPAEAKFRVVRGGCWRSHAGTCRTAYRNALAPYNRDPYTGFRVVAVVKSSKG